MSMIDSKLIHPSVAILDLNLSDNSELFLAYEKSRNIKLV